MLDVDKALAALAAGQPVDEAAYVFAAPGVKDSVNAELASWWPASAAHSPVLLAWAAVLCLVARSASESSSGTGAAQPAAAQEYIAYADKAHKTDALRTLRDLTTHAGLQPNAAEMFNNIVLRQAKGMLACPGQQLCFLALSDLSDMKPALVPQL